MAQTPSLKFKCDNHPNARMVFNPRSYKDTYFDNFMQSLDANPEFFGLQIELDPDDINPLYSLEIRDARSINPNIDCGSSS